MIWQQRNSIKRNPYLRSNQQLKHHTHEHAHCGFNGLLLDRLAPQSAYKLCCNLKRSPVFKLQQVPRKSRESGGAHRRLQFD